MGYPRTKQALARLLSRRIQKRMGELHLSRTDLADRSGCTYGTIRNLLEGRCVPRLDTLLAVAAALEVEPESLYRTND